MMGLGNFGGGVASSVPSSSNLSALAPPFTVDRSNSKPSTTSLLQFSESPYATSFGNTWQYPNAGASRSDIYQNSEFAASRPHIYQNSEFGADSTNFRNITSVNDYHFQYSVSQSDSTPSTHWSTLSPSTKTSTDAFLYDPKVEAYYPSYVSSVVDDRSPLVALGDPTYDLLPSSGLVSTNASAQVDYTQSLSGLEYTQNWGGTRYGLTDGKRGKQSEFDGNFITEKSNASDPVAYTNYLNQGPDMVGCEKMAEENSAGSCREFSDVRESSKHLARMEHADNISPLAQRIASLPFDSSTMSVMNASFTISESLLPGPSLQPPKNLANYQNLYNPYGKGGRPINSCFSTSVSVSKSSPTPVIRPPPVGTGLASQKSASGQTFDNVDIASVHQNEGIGNKSSSRGKEPQILQSSEGVEGSFFTSKLKNHKDEKNKVSSLSSSVVEGQPSKVQKKDILSPVLRMNSGAQFLNANTSDGSSLSGDSVLATKYSQNFADCLDHHNPAVDSPCWKGAPSSHFRPFDVVETDSSHHFMKKLDECHHMDLQVLQPFPPLYEPIGPPSEKAGKDKMQYEYGFAATDQISADMAKGIPTLTSSKGVQFTEESSKAREEYNVLNHSNSDPLLDFSDSKQLDIEGCNFATKKPNLQDAVMDTVMTVNDNTEGGAVAVRAAENVLSSPSSEESASEKPHESEDIPKMDVQTLIKAMQNLSDLLVFSCSSDTCVLKEQDDKALKHVMSNLNSLLSQKMVHMTKQEEPILPQLDNTEKIVEHQHPHKSIAAGKPQFESKASLKLEDQQYHAEKKAPSFQPSHPLMNELDVLHDDNISQAIKKVLDENSYFGEEEHSQAPLFKSLWLEAEAKLYAISYRARFDRMKIEMERSKSKGVKDVTENEAAPQKGSRSDNLNAPNTCNFRPPDVESVSTTKAAIQGSSNTADDIEASVMARRHMLNSCADTKALNEVPQQPADDVEASVMTRFHILKRRDDPNSYISVGKQADVVQAVYSDDSVTQSPGNSGKRNQCSIGSTDNSSSDWEHVLKEDISWR